MKYQVQLAYIFEPFVQRLDEDLDEIKDSEIGLLRIHGKYKVECCVMSINQFDVFSPFWHRTLEVITEGVRPIGHLLKYPTYDGLLAILPTHILIEFDEARLAAIVDDDYTFDHDAVTILLDCSGTCHIAHDIGLFGMAPSA